MSLLFQRANGALFSKRATYAITLRPFHSGSPKSFIENKQARGFNGILQADNAVGGNKIYHMTSIGLFALMPSAFILSPSALSIPADYAMSVIIPIHAHIGMNNVISDYVPKPQQPLARIAWLGVTVVMFFGLFRLNIQGQGVTETVKSIWRQPSKDD